MRRPSRIAAVISICLACATADAADRWWDGTDTGANADGGNGTWDNGSTANWDDAPTGGGNATWNNATPDEAFFTNSAGTVTLGEAITCSNMTIHTLGYTFSGSPLNFVDGSTIDITPSAAGNTKFNCSISGSPDVRINKFTDTKRTYFEPSGSAVHTLGNIIHPYMGAGSGDKGTLYLGGTSTNNTVKSIGWESHHYGYMHKTGTSKWTVNGDVKQGLLVLEGGTLIINGTFESRYAGISTIPSGTRLGGHLTLNTPSYPSGNGLNVNGGGIISPGDGGVGTITFHWGASGTDRSFKLSDNAVYEWDVGADSNDVIHIIHEGGGNPHTLDLDNFVIKIRDAGGAPKASDKLPIILYENMSSVDMTGFNNDENNFDTTDVPKWAGGNLSLADDGLGMIYLTGLNKPPAGMILVVR